jgi:hypothetical protein
VRDGLDRGVLHLSTDERAVGLHDDGLLLAVGHDRLLLAERVELAVQKWSANARL